MVSIDNGVEKFDNKTNLYEIRLVDIRLLFSLTFRHEMLQNILITGYHLPKVDKGLILLKIIENLLNILATPIKNENK